MRRVELWGKAPKKWDVCAPHSQGSEQRTNDFFFITDFSFRLAQRTTPKTMDCS